MSKKEGEYKGTFGGREKRGRVQGNIRRKGELVEGRQERKASGESFVVHWCMKWSKKRELGEGVGGGGDSSHLGDHSTALSCQRWAKGKEPDPDGGRRGMLKFL